MCAVEGKFPVTQLKTGKHQGASWHVGSSRCSLEWATQPTRKSATEIRACAEQAHLFFQELALICIMFYFFLFTSCFIITFLFFYFIYNYIMFYFFLFKSCFIITFSLGIPVGRQDGDGNLSPCHFSKEFEVSELENGDHFSLEKKDMSSKG